MENIDSILNDTSRNDYNSDHMTSFFNSKYAESTNYNYEPSLSIYNRSVRISQKSEKVSKKLITSKKRKRCLFQNSDRWKVWWDYLIMIAATINCYTIPIKVAYQPSLMDTVMFEAVNYAIDACFMMDILISFRTICLDECGNEIRQPCKIAIHYLKTTFMIDFLATAPLDKMILIFVRVDPNLKAYEIFGILKLGRVLRLNKLI